MIMLNKYLTSIVLFLITSNILADCVYLRTECIEVGGTRIIDGVSVTLPCWRERHIYTCKEDSDNNCGPLRDQGCSLVKPTCRARPDGLCAVQDEIFSCPVERCDEAGSISCAKNLFCVGTSCTTTTPKKNNNAADDKKAAAKQKSESDNGHYFYVGLSAAPDVSFIHLQKTSTLGTGAGLVVGYHLNKNISIESGALIEKKYYYTNGEYFNINKVPYFVANNIHPESVTGNCNMIEIPLNLKYTFKANGNNHFYAIGGVSSYLMGHENYTFNYNDWGAAQQSTWAYNNKANYLFSVLNLGVGYERKLGTKTNLRIEPYFKLPLTGFGTGSLKIASTGLYFTLTRKIF